MSTLPLTPGRSTPDADSPQAGPHLLQPQAPQPQRVLACVLCQQRKVKCDRRFPCANCVKHQVQCVPATQVRQRRRRFPERELLDRLRRYEDLLRTNNVKFEPLHKDPAATSVGSKEVASPEANYDSDDRHPEAGDADWSSVSTPKTESTYEAKNIWHAMSQGLRDPNSDSDSTRNDIREVLGQKAWDRTFDRLDGDDLLIGSPKTSVDLSTLHPEPAHIFKLWQVYLDNVNPLLKVTHTPTLQARIVEAVGNMANINPVLEALMFSIYCMAIQSLTADDCQATFNASAEDLLTKYRFGCRQALLNCSFLRSCDRDCLTALFLYLVSSYFRVCPRSLSSMFGVAIRIAQRMRMQNESASARCSPFEAEMRRRLWWALVLFDARIGELADHQATALAPTWDCRVPMDVNDSDMRPEMKELPPAAARGQHANITEAIFAVVRSEMGDFIRRTPFHLDFTNPALKPLIAGDPPGAGDLSVLGRKIEEEYLSSCDPDNPLHFMTMWMARGHLARCYLIDHYSRCYGNPNSGSGSPPAGGQAQAEALSDAASDAAMAHTFDMLDCDTKIMSSPLTKGYRWLLQFHFPMLMYFHIIYDLRRRPTSAQGKRAWEAMSDNYEVRFGGLSSIDTPIFRNFAGFVLGAWEAFEAAKRGGAGEGQPQSPPLTPPRIVTSVRQELAELAEKAKSADAEEQSGDAAGAGDADEFLASMPVGFDSYGLGSGNHNGIGGQGGYPGMDLDAAVYPNVPGSAPLPLGMLNHLSWASMNWGVGGRHGW